MAQRYALSILAFLLLSFCVAGQTVINSGGGSFDYDSVIHHISIGEPIISTTITLGDEQSYSHGFLQPFACMEIAGSVTYYSGKKIKSGSVVLYLRKEDNQAWRTIDSVALDTNGMYSFLAFPDVDYVVKYKPVANSNSKILTSYSVEAKKWGNADVWSASCGSNISANILLQTKAAEVTTPTVTVTTKPSTTQTSDNVNIQWQTDDNETEEQQTVSSDQRYQITGNVASGGSGKVGKVLGDPIPGIDVSLEQIPGGSIVAQTSTDDEGYYQFDNIPPGNYTISVDVPGVPQVETYGLALSDDEDTTVTNLNFAVEEGDGIYLEETSNVSINEATIGQGELSIYPNPFYTSTQIQFDNPKKETFEMRVIHLSGKLAHKQIIRGTNRFYFDRSDLPPGVYLLQIFNENQQYNARLIMN